MSNVKCPISNAERFLSLVIGNWTLVIALGSWLCVPDFRAGLPLSIAKELSLFESGTIGDQLNAGRWIIGGRSRSKEAAAVKPASLRGNPVDIRTCAYASTM